MRMALASEVGVTKVDLLEQSTQLLMKQENRKLLEKVEGIPQKFLVIVLAQVFVDLKKFL